MPNLIKKSWTISIAKVFLCNLYILCHLGDIFYMKGVTLKRVLLSGFFVALQNCPHLECCHQKNLLITRNHQLIQKRIEIYKVIRV